MNSQESLNYYRIAEAIEYIRAHFRQQPDLDEVAARVHLSPFHFQRMFTEWAGVSPKKFLQYLSVEHAKNMLRQEQTTLSETAFGTGLSGTGRLHDLFVNIEGMTPGEYKNGGAGLDIRYRFAESPFGKILVASTSRGVCYMAFSDDQAQALDELGRHFPNARMEEGSDLFQENALQALIASEGQDRIELHLKGTDFQLKVWSALLMIPAGGLSTYGKIAASIGHPKASRAVGSAVGDNPVAFLIPCHRVIRSSGELGSYHWGSARKCAMIGWEAAREDRNG